ncbi:methyl-accepting chemotaxis protein [Halorarum halobium]|uniref:methyl-accepting chemotaxis protein n=1 Tax=Halorarum halobium TaxID=3075121 RepID=UPI0028AE6A51|nr:methyl-accepting chemotaxis protein [Halobaculum sp. XH14]
MTLVPDAIRRSYLRKFAAVTLLTLVVVAGVGAAMQGQVASDLRERTHDDLRSSAELNAADLGGWVEEHRQTTRLVSDMAKGRDDTGMKTLFGTEVNRLPGDVAALHYVDAETMRVNVSSDEAAVGTTLDGVVWEETGSQSLVGLSPVGTAVSSVFGDDDQRKVAFASYVPGTTNAVVMTVNATARDAALRSAGTERFTRVVDGRTATVQFASDVDRAGSTYPGGTEAPAVNAASSGESGVHEADGSDVVTAYAPVEGTDWVVVTTVPKSSAYALATDVRRGFLIVIGLSLLGFVVLGVTMGRTTGVTLRGLAGRAEALANGETDVDATRTDRIDEVGDVRNAIVDVTEYLDSASAQADAVARKEFDAAAFDEDVPGELGESLLSMRADLRSLIAEMEATNEELERVAAAYGDRLDAAADGDLTVRLPAETDNEAMRSVAHACNGMLADLERTVGRVDSVADEVARSSTEASEGVAEAEQASREVASATDEISAGAAEQSEHLSEVTSEMGQLSAAVEEVAATAGEVAEQSTEAVETGEEGTALADAAVDEMAAIESASEETADAVGGLESEVEEIGEIVELIDGIAEQTNVLALNASIEAARAGEAGEGFAVVAEEVKSLATETREATARIAGLVEQVQDSTDDAVADIEGMRERVADGTETIEAGLSALEDVVDAVESANDGVQSISRAADDQAASAEEVATLAEDVATVSEETAAEADTVSAAAEEQSASLDQVSGEVARVSERATELRSLTEQFETEHEREVNGDSVAEEAGRGGTSGDSGFAFDGETVAADDD